MKIIGLTGSVASGKNFVAHQFHKFNIPIFDADQAVHELFANDKEVFRAIEKHFPKAIINGKIDRKKLGEEVLNNRRKLDIVENIVHPKVQKLRENFIKKSTYRRKKMVILNIPLLFEKGGFKRCDKIIAVITPTIIQKERFLKRAMKNNPTLSNDKILEKFYHINQNQISNYYKKKLADFTIYNGLDKAFAIKQIKRILNYL